jgi:hypothetical protein
MRKTPLAKSFVEINRATRELSRLRNARSFEIVEEAWLAGVMAVERAWEKAAAEYKSVAEFAHWNAIFVGYRRSDPLLQYVNQVRNATEHTIEETIQHQPVSLSINPVLPGGKIYIKEMVINNGRVGKLDTGGSPVRLEIRAPRAELRSFTNRGALFAPPDSHMGLPMDGSDPIAVLERAIKFYETYLNDLLVEVPRPA